MAKERTRPINIQAQRFSKVIKELKVRLKVLSILNLEFFEEIRKAENVDVIEIFGSKTAKQLINHSILEDKFLTQCIEDGVKMTNREELPDEALKVADDLEVSTRKLVRIFSNEEDMMRLKNNGFKKDSNEFNSFNDTIADMDILFD